MKMHAKHHQLSPKVSYDMNAQEQLRPLIKSHVLELLKILRASLFLIYLILFLSFHQSFLHSLRKIDYLKVWIINQSFTLHIPIKLVDIFNCLLTWPSFRVCFWSCFFDQSNIFGIHWSRLRIASQMDASRYIRQD